jgi:MinD-like ATPase involved in chromosome partitioning or flagellar assembly
MTGKRKGRSDQTGETFSGSSTDGVIPPFRLAAGLGDPERERLVLSALASTGDIVVAERCLSADQLVACVQHGSIDVILVSYDLHRLNEARLDELTRSRLPVALLTPDPNDERWHSFPGALVSVDAEPDTMRQALLDVIRGEHRRPATPRAEAEAPSVELDGLADAPEALSVITLASGHGSPGRTTVALGLAAALGAVAPTILVDADLSGPSIAAWLDADPTRNISMLVHAEPETARDWDRAIKQEVQLLHPRSPHAVVLCGVPKPEMRSLIPVSFFERLVAELRQRYRYVVLDTGADFLGAEVALHRVALAQAQQILLVASPDVVGLWHARTALGLLQNQLALGPERLALLINGHDRRYHHTRAEIEWALGLLTAAIIPYDHGSVQRALAVQHPLILERRSRAGHSLVDLAERVHGGTILLPSETKVERGGRRVGWHRPQFGRRGRSVRSTEHGGEDGEYAAPIS